jgi:hypothetical protein
MSFSHAYSTFPPPPTHTLTHTYQHKHTSTHHYDLIFCGVHVQLPTTTDYCLLLGVRGVQRSLKGKSLSNQRFFDDGFKAFDMLFAHVVGPVTCLALSEETRSILHRCSPGMASITKRGSRSAEVRHGMQHTQITQITHTHTHTHTHTLTHTHTKTIKEQKYAHLRELNKQTNEMSLWERAWNATTQNTHHQQTLCLLDSAQL